MSKFFRTFASSDSESSESASLASDEDESPSSAAVITGGASPEGTGIGSKASDENVAVATLPIVSEQTIARTTPGVDNSQLLLHSLLEERCVREVTDELASRGILPHQFDQEYIKLATHQRYQSLCVSLAQHNLITKGPENETHSSTRQTYRDGLSLLSRELASKSAAPFTYVRRKLLTASEIAPTTQAGYVANLGALDLTVPPSSLMLAPTRYVRDFDQISILGRGGFGVVFQVQNRIDGVQYAVKKVPINPARIARVQAHGQAEIAELTREVRCLARLEHPNIVRYYAAWVEWSGPLNNSANSQSSFMDEESNSVMRGHSAQTSRDGSLHRVVTESGSDILDVVFEDSAANPRTKSLSSKTPSAASSSDPVVSQSMVSESATDGALMKQSGPTLCLHLQMGLYPLTLADFISPPPSSDTSVQPLCHCFHLEPALKILSAIVCGVDYLHSESILHRDLKPANIFMTAQAASTSSANSLSTNVVNLVDCSDCRACGNENPVHLNVRIGDFGLVTELARPEASSREGLASVSPVGTEIYRPLSVMSNVSPQLDLYALGIIMFELLWKFDTRMERHECIQRLKRGALPDRFSSIIGDLTGGVEKCIKDMLSGQLEIVTLRQRIRELQTMKR